MSIISDKNLWKNSNVFLIAMIGAVLGLTSLTQFSFLVYNYGGGAFFIPYVISIVLIGVPFLILEFGLGFKFKSSLSKILFNIKDEFEYLGWFIIFIIFLLLSIYVCMIGWDLIYVILSLFKGWGSNPTNFFNQTLLHSSSNLYALTYIVVPIAISILGIWISIYFVSKKGIGGISKFVIVTVPMIIVLMAVVFISVLSLDGAKLGMAFIIRPKWNCLLDYHVWITAFTQVLFTLLLGQGIASSFSSYLEEKEDSKLRLVDNAWIIVLVSFIIQVIFTLVVFGLIGSLISVNSSAINVAYVDSTNLIFVILPMVFNNMGISGNVIAFGIYLLLLVAGLTSAIAIIEPFISSITEKFGLNRSRALRYICLIGSFISFIFATGMGQYLISVVSSFLMHFAILLAILLEIVIVAGVYGADRLIDVVNKGSFIKVDSFWIIFIKFITPIILIVLIVLGVYDLISSGDSRTLFIDSIVAIIFVIAPLVLTLNLINNDYFDLDLNLDLHTLGQNKNLSKKYAEFSSDGSFINPYKNKKDKRNGKNVISNVDLSSSAFDSPHEATLDDFEDESVNDDTRGKSVFGKINMFNKAKENSKDSFSKLNGDSNDSDNESDDLNSNLNDLDDNSDADDFKHSEGYDYDDLDHDEYNNFNSSNKLGKEFSDYVNSFDDNSKEIDDNYDGKSINPLLSLSKFKSLFGKKNSKYDVDEIDDVELEELLSRTSKKPNFDEVDEEDYSNITIQPIHRSSSNNNFNNSTDNSYGMDNLSEDIDDRNNANINPMNPKKSKFKKSLDFDFKEFDDADLDSQDNPVDKKSSNISNSNKNHLNTLNSNGSSNDNEENEFIDFDDDFFDDGVFDDGSYESLLDDYIEPKTFNSSVNSLSSSKNNSGNESEIMSNNLNDDKFNSNNTSKIKTKVNKSKNKPKTITISADNFDEDKEYDFESKGSDSVFNLDE